MLLVIQVELPGFGGVLRNHMGEWMSGFAGSIGVTINMIAELQAIKQGLRMAWEKV